jgi:hypothetical protein
VICKARLKARKPGQLSPDDGFGGPKLKARLEDPASPGFQRKFQQLSSHLSFHPSCAPCYVQRLQNSLGQPYLCMDLKTTMGLARQRDAMVTGGTAVHPQLSLLARTPVN